MPFKDENQRREYLRRYMAARRAAGETPWETREKKTEAKRRERETMRAQVISAVAGKISRMKP